ncbi:MAG TPA: hypothetical protein VLT36_19530 [Candidatus Dormibacteraeota bacterium]|nr:hypothetical protein [Candidatus Dormibacteraeota bacterium]
MPRRIALLFLCISLLGAGAATPAQKNVPPGQRPATNFLAGKTNPATSRTNAVASKGNAPASALDKARQFVQRNKPASIAGGIVVLLLLFYAGTQLMGKKEEKAHVELAMPSRAKALEKETKAAGRAYAACNVLQVGKEARQLWQFDARNGGFVLNREQTSLPGEALPYTAVAKDFRSLWQRKLNVAWLPPENVFLRVIQLPHSEFKETVAMVELQLEKLSPLPVAQIVWSIQVLTQSSGLMQTVIVIIVARSVVEEFLGQLEGQGFLADALELPLLDQLQATPITEDGVWIYPEALGGKRAGLAAWWYGGVLHNLDLVTLPPADQAEVLKEQLTQMAWAGELDGWLTSPPRWHLVAAGNVAAEWGPVLQSGLGQVEVVEPLPPPQLAAATAKRAARSSPGAGLLPPEFATRYHQQFVDRLWMGSLAGVIALYAVGVIVYFIAVTFASYRTGAVESQTAGLSHEYTNTIQLRARYNVLKERDELKYAALNCWKKVAELLPETATLDGWTFADGKRLTINGTAPSDGVKQLIEFDNVLRKAVDDNGKPMFDWEKSETLTWHSMPGGNVTWTLGLELKRSDEQ